MKKPVKPSSANPVLRRNLEAPPGWEDVPLLWAHLSDAYWDDGTSRACSSLVIFTEGLITKACLSDRELSLVLFRTGDSLVEALTALEKALREDTADWRPAKGNNAKR